MINETKLMTIGGMAVTVHYTYDHGEADTWDTPGTGQWCEIDKFFIDNIDVTDFVFEIVDQNWQENLERELLQETLDK